MRADAPGSAPTAGGRSDAGAGAAAEDPQVFVQPTRLDRFVLIREIGAGGMGTVFAAYDERLDRQVALKLLSQKQPSGPLPRAQVLREARAAARISHPNVISIYEVGETDEQIYIAMEYVDGGTLYKWQQTGHPWQKTLAMYLQVGEALHAAHVAEVVHRDFKPDNVLLGHDGRPRVVDFGLARVGWSEEPEEFEVLKTPEEGAAALASGRLTIPGLISGTPGYMSPEQYRGGDVDSRSDQWSFCAALYEALYGFLPFAGETAAEYRKSVFGPPRHRPSATQVPDEIHAALLRGLSKAPSDRFESMDELIATLAREQRGGAAAGTWSRRRLSVGLLVVALFSFGVLQLRQIARPLTHRDTLVPSLLMVMVLLFGGILNRRTLRASRFHRHVFVIVTITILQNFSQRIFGTVLDLPLRWQFPFEMVLLAGGTAILGATLIRALLPIALLPLLSAGAGVMEWLPQRVLTVTHLIMLLAFVLGWSHAAHVVKESGAEGLGGSSGGARRPGSSGTHRASSPVTQRSGGRKRSSGPSETPSR